MIDPDVDYRILWAIAGRMEAVSRMSPEEYANDVAGHDVIGVPHEFLARSQVAGLQEIVKQMVAEMERLGLMKKETSNANG